MVYRSVVVIGLGTLGGFVAEAISNLETVEKIVIIDHDIVEKKNLRNSIYRQIDIGVLKTKALKDILTSLNPDLEVIAIGEKYIEENENTPDGDLVLDCRDYTYDRHSKIDARLYISSRYLMADFRKNVSYKNHQEGKYISELTKNDLRYAASIVSMMIHSNAIHTLMSSQSVQKYELDYVKHIDNCAYDVVYEDTCGNDKFVNLPDKIVPILVLNKKKDINVYVGSRRFPVSEKLIQQNELKDIKDIVSSLISVAACQKDFNHFVVSVYQEGGHAYVELIPETGAA